MSKVTQSWLRVWCWSFGHDWHTSDQWEGRLCLHCGLHEAEAMGG